MEETKKSGVKGVSWNKKTQKWIVKLSNKYFGSFNSLEDAIQKRREIENQKRNDYCSNECKKIGKEQYHKERYQSTRPKPRICVICGQPIPADKNPRAIVCSDACGRIHRQQYQRSYYEQHRHVPVQKRKASPIAGDPTVTVSFSAPASMRDWILDSANANKESLSKFMRKLIQREIDKKEGTE